MIKDRSGNAMVVIVIFGIIVTFSYLIITSCGRNIHNNDDKDETIERFYTWSMYAEDSNGNVSTYPMKVYVDRDTRVQYLVNTRNGGMCVMVDAEGKPLLYEGEFMDKNQE